MPDSFSSLIKLVLVLFSIMKITISEVFFAICELEDYFSEKFTQSYKRVQIKIICNGN